jgi:hypothetical protein
MSGGDGCHADRVFVYILVKILSRKTVVASLQGHNPRLDIEIEQELLPDNLDVVAGYYVWPTNIFYRLLSSLPSIPLVGQTAQHTSLGRTDGRSSVRLCILRAIPQVVQPSNALRLRLLRVWIHVGIGRIPIHVTIVNILRLRLTIGSDQGREV